MNKFTEVVSRQLVEMLDDQQEIAVIDVRDYGEYLTGHLWLATRIPYACIELKISRYVPRLDTRVVLIDRDQSLSGRTAASLQTMGYGNLHVLKGGLNDWEDAGYPLIEGDYVLAHAFGLYINRVLGTPSISAETLMRIKASREKLVIIDSRDPADYQGSSLPGSINIPIADLVQSVPDIVDDETTQIVVHCGGVTRAVLGAQTLIDAKFTNPVMWLEDGTTGWAIAGGNLQPGSESMDTPPSEEAKKYSRNTTRDLANRYNLIYIGALEIAQWKVNNQHRTCYLIDVRNHEKFLAGHYPGALNIPGGELVGMMIDHIATYHARLCLMDDADSACAEITAAWLLRNGWNDVVLLNDWERQPNLETGPEKSIDLKLPQPALPVLDTPELKKLLSEDSTRVAILDFSHSSEYDKQHIPGAYWCLRSSIPQSLEGLDDNLQVVVVSRNDKLSQLIAIDIREITGRHCSILSGGTQEWLEQENPSESGMSSALCERLDVRLAPTHQTTDKKQEVLAGLQYSVDIRQHIFNRYQLDQPFPFNCLYPESD